MSDKMRGEFEVWAEAEALSLSEYCDGWYGNQKTHYAWKAWQASRKAIKVELPDRGIDFVTAYYECDDVHRMLTKAGISYD